MNLTIYKKIMIGFGVVILVMVIANAYVLFEMNAVSKAIKVTFTSDVQSIDLAKQLQTFLYDHERYAQKYLITRDTTYYTLFEDGTKRFGTYLDSLLTIRFDDQEQRLMHQIRTSHTRYVDALRREHDRIDRGDAGKNSALDSAIGDSLEYLQNALDDLIRLNQLSVGTSMANVETTTARSSNVALVETIAALLAAIAVAFVIAHSITKPIGVLIHGTEQIARNNFTPIRVTSRDEIAQLADAVNDMSEKLKQINDLKAEVLHQISHEIRTPLQTILSAQVLLLDQKLGPLNPEQIRMLGSIRNSINKLTSFTHQILDVAKIEAGMMEYHLEQTDIVKLVTPVVEEARLTALRRNLTINLVTNPVPPIQADTEKISMVISNLLSNAIKYTDKEGTISVTVEPCKKGVRVSVQDTGVGIAPEDLPKVFTKFYQATNASRASSKGTGVGLALVKAHTEGHGGSVYVTSTLGTGSTFTVELPAATSMVRGALLQTVAIEKKVLS